MGAILLDNYGHPVRFLYQWDYNQKLVIDDVYSDVYTDMSPVVQFCSKDSEEVLSVSAIVSDGKIVSDIPNILLQEPYNIIAYILMINTSSGKVVNAVEIPVRKRAKPPTYEYSDNVDIISIESLIKEASSLKSDMTQMLDEAKTEIASGVTDAEEKLDNLIASAEERADGLINTISGDVDKVVDGAKSEMTDTVNAAKSYAVGGTGTRENEDTDNSKYYAEQAKKYEQFAMATTPDGFEEFVTQVADATSNITNLANELAESNNTIDALNNKIASLESLSDSYCEELEVDSEGLVYLLNNGERIAGPYGPFAGSGGGGSTGGNTATLVVSNTTGWLSTTIAEGDLCAVNLTWSSLEDGMQTGNGTAKVIVNGVSKAVLNIQQGTISIDVSKYLSAGSNTVRITIADIYDNSRTITFSISCVQISISSSFDPTTVYTGAITFAYTPLGSVSKTIHFVLDGSEIGSMITSVSGRQMTYVIPQQTHGAHTFNCYFTCEINNQTVKSNTLHYEFICIADGEDATIITSSFNTQSVSQYTTLHIDYMVYNPASLTAEVNISANGKQISSLTVDRTSQVLAYRADTVGDLTFTFVSNGVSKEISLSVTASDVNVEAETDQLVLYLSSYGRSNNEADPSVWESNDISAVLTDFNYTSDGWVSDDDGITVLRVAGDARVDIPYQPFASDFRGTGKTIEIEFATRDVMNYDSVIFSCSNGNRGLELTAQQATLKSEQSNISMQYKEDEHVRLSFVVEKRSENRLIYIYVNGIMSGSIQYPASDDFSQVSPVNITIGSNDCTIDIYCIRIYDNNLTRTQILNNWIADTQDVTELLDRYQRNSVYDEYGSIVISKLPSSLPYMIITAEELPQYKGDKKTVSVSYVDPVDGSKSFTAEGVEANVQGTSSQYYPRKNYKMKYKKGFDLTQSGTHVSKYALRTGQIEVNTFTMKADVASSEGCNNTELVRLYNDSCTYKTPAQKENSAVRQGIDGFPIAMFWNNGEETTFIGKYNFNNDKGTEELFGFADDDESWEILNNTSDRVLWKSDDFESTVKDDDGNETAAWLNDFEARFPDTDPVYTDSTQLKAFASFLKSTDRDQATNATLASSVVYDGVTYTKDTEEYRLAKFKAEIGNYVELESAKFYYLFTELFLMVDSRAKNAFPSFIGSEVTA